MEERFIIGRCLWVSCVTIVRQGKSEDMAPDALELQRLTEDRNAERIGSVELLQKRANAVAMSVDIT